MHLLISDQMLSILIPTYNYNCFALVTELHRQCNEVPVEFEIIVLDDGSQLFHIENQQINQLSHCSYTILGSNIGRSKIRNLLAQKAKYQQLLFLDADVFPRDKNFISNYLAAASEVDMVVAGGLLYQANPPSKELMLRWKYGSAREARSVEERRKIPYQALLASNFMISKKVLEKVPFCEEMPDLRREDTLFSYDLRKNNVKVMHIDNPVFHLGIDSFEVMIKKEHESLDGLIYILEHGQIEEDYIKISRLYSIMKRWHLKSFFAGIFKLLRPALLKNLSSKDPSLKVYDLYRIGYLCFIKGYKSSY